MVQDKLLETLAGDTGWTPHALGILERACDHYGGMEMSIALQKIRLLPGRLSGLVPWLKGNGRTFTVPSAFDCRLKRSDIRDEARHMDHQALQKNLGTAMKRAQAQIKEKEQGEGS